MLVLLVECVRCWQIAFAFKKVAAHAMQRWEPTLGTWLMAGNVVFHSELYGWRADNCALRTGF